MKPLTLTCLQVNLSKRMVPGTTPAAPAGKVPSVPLAEKIVTVQLQLEPAGEGDPAAMVQITYAAGSAELANFVPGKTYSLTLA